MGSKLCKKCLQTKPIGEFYRHPQMGDGHLSKCKECTKADVREQRAANVEYYRNYDRLRYDLAGNRHSSANENRDRSEYVKRWYRSNRHKARAQLAARRAIASGRLIRPSACEECHVRSKNIEAHHEDYSKPLDIKWLCKKCHGNTRKKPRIKFDPRRRGGFAGPMKPTRA